MVFQKKIVLLIGAVCIAVIGFSQTLTKEEMQRKTQDLLREIETLKETQASIQKNKKQSIGALRAIERKIDIRSEVLNSIKGEVNYVQNDIIRTYRDIDTLKRELVLLKSQYSQSIVYAYKNRSNYDFLNFLFSASAFKDAMKRVSYLKTYRNFREQKSADISRTKVLLESKIASLTGKREEKTKVLNEQRNQMAVLEEEKKEKDQVISQLKAKENELTAAMKRKENERKKIQNAIAAVIKREKDEAMRRDREDAAKRKAAEEAARKAAAATAAPKTGTTATTTTTTTVPEPAKLPVKKVRESSVLENTPEGLVSSQNFEQNRGRMPWPVDRALVRLHYGPNRIPGKTRDLIIPSPGISIETNEGATVKAIFDGEVVTVSSIGEMTVVMIKHGKYFSTYSNLQGVTVSRGQKVITGQSIGKAGVNDEGVGSVDLQIDTDKGTINPELWIRAR